MEVISAALNFIELVYRERPEYEAALISEIYDMSL
jgi:hypothetical protein